MGGLIGLIRAAQFLLAVHLGFFMGHNRLGVLGAILAGSALAGGVFSDF